MRGPRLSQPLLRLASLVVFLGLSLPFAHAQARITANRDVELSAFGGYTYVDNDYAPPYDNNGLTLGVEYTQFLHRFHGLLIPSAQIRGTYTPGSSNTQKTLLGGLKLATTTWKGIHPYADLLVGNGVILFPHPSGTFCPTCRDSSFVYDLGGGLTYRFRRDWSVLADYQAQYWDIGRRATLEPIRFYPQSITLGLVYHLHFKSFKTYP